MNEKQKVQYKAIEKAMYDLRMAGYTINDPVYCALIKERASLEYPKKFVSQTAMDDDGNYTMTWKKSDSSIVTTSHNLFE
tara:strand:- start:468 stop:707 length:240 start_codon:yes stop_codon:yes gene_type:complete